MTITIASQVLPDPQRYTVTDRYRGKGTIMADGTPAFDLVNDTKKYRFVLGWVALTSAQRALLETAWGTLKDTSASMTDYDTNTYTVSRDPASPDLKFDGVIAANGPFWSVTVTLLEE